MKCMVIGGAGFIGSNLVDRLVDDGYDVKIVDNLSTGKEENINPNAKFFNKDITDINKMWPYQVDEMFGDVDIVFHLAAKARVQPSIESPVEYNNVNVSGLLNVLDACVKYKVKRFVYSSSSSVYGNVENLPTTEEHKLSPMSPYALHKLVGEQYCKLYSEFYGLETVCLRYFNVYGERQILEGSYACVMGIFANQVLEGNPMTIRGDGEQRRDFTYVGDVVEANVKAGTKKIKFEGDVFNIGNGDNRSVNQLADMIGGDRVNVEAVLEPRKTLADNGKARFMLDWKPTTKMEDWINGYREDIGL